MPETIVADESTVTPTDATAEAEGGVEGEESLGTPAARAEAQGAKDKAALESSVGDLLTKAFNSTDSDEEPAAEAEAEAEETPDEEEETPAESDEEEVVDEDGKEAEEAAAKPAKVVKPDANAPTLPAALVRTLKAYEWTDAEIAQNLKVLGSKFVETAAKLHKNRNDETLKWAEAGRQQKAQQQQQRQNAPAQVDTSAALPMLDMKALKTEFGDDKLFDKIVGPVNAAIERMNLVLPQLQQVQNQSVTNQQETLVRHIDGFFGGKELEPYKEVYGDASTIGSNKTHQDARNKVLEMADALMVGAGAQGRSLTLGEALTLAHDSISSGYKIKAVRTTIKKELVQRSKAITQRPSGRAPNNPSGVNGSKSALEKKVGGLLSKAFA
jgi:hypothetical protein